MPDFTTEWKETKVVMSIQEFDKYREMERAIKERKAYSIWIDSGGHGQTKEVRVMEESQIIEDLTDRIHKLTSENFELKNKKKQ